MPDPAWSECCAPARFGGKGLLQLTPIADLAAEANVRSSLKLALELCPSIVSSFPRLLPLIGFTGQCEDLQPKKEHKLQRELCNNHFEQEAAARRKQADEWELARISSCCGAGVASAFAPPPGEDDDLWHQLPRCWMPPSTFRCALRISLGLPVVQLRGQCPYCDKAFDDLNFHVTNCVRGGGRQRTHSALKQAVFSAASAAQWCPRLETQPFIDDTGRVDVECFWMGERLLGDTAVVGHTGPHLAAAAETPGGAATCHEATKHRRYGKAAAATDPRMKILPLVWDTYGAPGATAAVTICKLAKGVAQRFDLSITRVISMLRERLAGRIICSIGDIAAEAGWRIHNARPLCRSSTAFAAVADCG